MKRDTLNTADIDDLKDEQRYHSPVSGIFKFFPLK